MAGSKDKITLEGDVQLWVFRDQGWEIPIRVRRCFLSQVAGLHYTVSSCLVLADEPMNILSIAMELRTVGRGRTFYVVPASKLEEVAVKAEGITPSFYYRHNGIPQNAVMVGDSNIQLNDDPPPPGKLDLDLVDDIAKESNGLFNPDTARAVLLTLANMAHRRLVEDMKPIDLGFCRIHAVPYRATWKAILSNRHPDGHKQRSGPEWAKWRDSHAFDTESVYKSELMETDRTSNSRAIFVWNLEVESLPMFDKPARDFEVKRVGLLGSVRYCERWCAIIDELKETIFNLWTAWTRKAVAPRAQVSSRSSDGAQVIGSRAKYCRVIPDAGRDSLEHLTGGDRLVPSKSLTRHLPEATPDVLQVSDLQPEVVDMRDARGGDRT